MNNKEKLNRLYEWSNNYLEEYGKNDDKYNVDIFYGDLIIYLIESEREIRQLKEEIATKDALLEKAYPRVPIINPNILKQEEE